MDLKRLSLVAFGGLLFSLLHGTNGEGPIPDQGFFMAARYPETGRSSILHIYALDTFAEDGEFAITKDGGLPSNGIETGEVIGGRGDVFGCFLRVFEFNRMRGLRYGLYSGSLTLEPGLVLNGYTMVKPKTDILDTRGIQTVTIYPESVTSSDLAEPVSIGVGFTPGCRRIKWDKGRRAKVNTGPRMTLTSTEDAGLYTLRRRTRAKRGWFVQILVIAASCPENHIYDVDECIEIGLACKNGGVLMDKLDDCMCPPFLVGDNCACAASYDGGELPLAVGLTCGDLPGGDPACKGMLICYGDNYGCKCASGWWGNACDRACPKGRWGVDCDQRCPDSESDCNRFWGPKTNLFDNGCTITEVDVDKQ